MGFSLPKNDLLKMDDNIKESNYLSMIKVITQLIFILLFSASVKASTTDTSKQEIKAIEVQQTDPFFGEAFYRIFHISPFIVYQSQYQFDSASGRGKFDSAGNWVSSDSEYALSEKRSQFFVFHRDSSYGFSYDPHRSNFSNRRLLVDSAVLEIKGTYNFENLLTKIPDTTTWNASRTERREVYVQKATKDTPTVRAIFYYNSSLNFLQASLNTAVDSAKKMKLYKFEYLIEEFYSEKDERLWPAMSFSTEMKEVTVMDTEEIMHFIERYKNNIVADKHFGNKVKNANNR